MALNSLFSPNGFSVGNLFNPTNVVLANGDITAGNSVTANYFLGNGAFLTGIVTSAGNTTVSNTAPVSAQQGDVWIQANTGIQYIYFTSGGNSQWAEMEAAISISNSTGGNYGDSNVAAYLSSNAALTILTTGNITSSANVSGSYILGNGAFLTGISGGSGSYSNSNVAAYGESGWAGNIIPAANVTYTLGNSTRQWANLWVASNTIYIGGVALGVANGQLTVSGNTVVSEGTSLSGNIETTGNIVSGNFIANNAVTSATVTATGTGTFGNVSVAGNINAGNISVIGNISTQNDITAVTITTENTGTFGNVSTAGTVAATGNIVGGNLISNNTISGITIATTGTGTFGNVSTAGTVTATGNITGGNITTTGFANLGITQVNGNLVVTGNISATGNITYINVSDLVVSDPLLFLAANNPGDVEDIGLVAHYNPGSGNLHTGFVRDYTDSTWKVFEGVSSDPNTVINWSQAVYAGFKAGSILSNATITANGNVTGANFSTVGTITATGNIISGNILSNAAITGTRLVISGNATSGNLIANYVYGDISNATGGFGNNAVLTLLGSNTAFNITTTGGITANTVQAQYLYGNGTFITGLPATFGNANLVTYGEAGWSGNIIPEANGAYNLGSNSNRWNDVYINSTLYLPFQSLTSNSTRIIASSSLSAYNLISTNDVTAASNVTATGNVSGSYVLGNIRFSTGGYNDTNVAAYTGALSNLTGNVTTTANVSGSYILGNGYFLSGISGGGGSTYGDANVAAYLASNAALTINTTANISTSANVSAGNFLGTSLNTTIKTGNYLWTFGSTGNLTIPGNVNANSYYINNLTNPVQDQDAATKVYVDNLVSTSLSYHEAVAAATTTTLAATTGGTITYNQVNGVGNGIGATLTTTGSFNLIDTANVQTANTRILVKNEANGAHNGVYVWSNATAITRASTENTAGVGNVDALGINDYFYTTGGNVNKGSAFIVDAPNTAIVFGTSNIQFAIFSQSQVYSANTAAGISLATTTISAKVDNDTTAFDGGGNISVKAGANLVTPNIGAATGTSLNVTGNITGGGNISGTYILGNGAFLTGISGGGGGGSYGNSNVADYLASNSAVTILTTANITTSANISGGNFLGSASNTTIKTGAYTWTFDSAGNLNIDSASGTIVGANANTTIQTGSNRWNFASDGQLYLPGNIVAGYRDIPQISWTGTPTIALADLGEHYYTASGGVTINIPTNASAPLPIGAAVTLVNQSGANCTIGANPGVTLYLAGNATTGNRTLAWYGFATLVKVATDTWFVNGANVI